MPWINPQLISERVARHKPVLQQTLAEHIGIALEKRTNWSRRGNCRIVLVTPVAANKEKDKIKAIVAVSSEEGDLLENEWE
jgi:hypothetical protein